jgi:hypothetical protein
MLSIVAICLFLSLGLHAQQPGTTSLPAGNGQTEKLVKLYPNPAVAYVNFELKDNNRKMLTLQIYNGILGKKMVEYKISGDRYTLNLNDFTRGLYIYHLVDPNGKILESGKFQVSK